MGVPRQIAEHLFWSAEWGFGVDHPILILQGRDQLFEASRVGPFTKFPIKPQLPFHKRFPEIGDELSAKQRIHEVGILKRTVCENTVNVRLKL